MVLAPPSVINSALKDGKYLPEMARLLFYGNFISVYYFWPFKPVLKLSFFCSQPFFEVLFLWQGANSLGHCLTTWDTSALSRAIGTLIIKKIISEALLLDTHRKKTVTFLESTQVVLASMFSSLLLGKLRINQGLLLWHKRNNLLHWASWVSALMSVPV